MRLGFVASALLVLSALAWAVPASAAVVITIDKSAQRTVGARRRSPEVSLAGVYRRARLHHAERYLHPLPDGAGPLFRGMGRCSHAALDLLHLPGSRYPRQHSYAPSRQSRFPWLRTPGAGERGRALSARRRPAGSATRAWSLPIPCLRLRESRSTPVPRGQQQRRRRSS